MGPTVKMCLDAFNPENLNPEQTMFYNMFKEHFDQFLDPKQPKPDRILLNIVGMNLISSS